jgi:hypothetical protein
MVKFAHRLDKRFRPTESNRLEAVDRMAFGLNVRHLNEGMSHIDSALRAIQEFLGRPVGAKHPPEYSIQSYGFELANTGVCLIKNGNLAEGWRQIQLGTSASYWGQIGHRCANQHYDWPDSRPFVSSESAIFHFFHLCAVGPIVMSKRLAYHLYNVFGQGGLTTLPLERDFLHFAWILIKAFAEGKWILAGEVSNELGSFRAIIEKIDDRDAFAEALVAYGDFRLSRAYGFPETSSTRRMINSRFVFGAHWIGLCPMEILGMTRIYEHLTEKKVSIEVDHPIFQTSFMHPPRFDSLPTDSTIDALCDKFSQEFGSNWNPEHDSLLVTPL